MKLKRAGFYPFIHPTLERRNSAATQAAAYQPGDRYSPSPASDIDPGPGLPKKAVAGQEAQARPETAACDPVQSAPGVFSPCILSVLEDPAVCPQLPEGAKTLRELLRDAAPQVAPVAAASSADQPSILSRSLRASRLFGNQILALIGQGDPVLSLRYDLAQINSLEASAQQLKTPEAFAAKTAEFKARLANGESLSSLRAEAYAVAREACRLALGMRPYDEQILGGLAMDNGRAADMKTGEGKTMTAVMPVYLNALAGKGACVITANETLVQRDAENMGPVYQCLGLKVGTVLEAMTPEQKRAGYGSDVTYLTNSCAGFDYLRDRICRRPLDRVQREPFFALVDEIDEVLIDEARVPLIISQTTAPAQNLYRDFAHVAAQMVPGDDFLTERDKQAAYLTETGQDFVANQLAVNRARGRIDRAHARADKARQNLDKAGPAGAVAGKTLERCQRLIDRSQHQLEVGQKLSQAIRLEQRLERELNDYSAGKPGVVEAASAGFDKAEEARRQEALEAARSEKKELQQQLPGFNVYHPAHAEQVSYLQGALTARGLFRLGKDYTLAFPEKLGRELSELCQSLRIEPSERNQAKLLCSSQSLGTSLAELAQLLGDKGSEPMQTLIDGVVAQSAQLKGVTAEQLLTTVFKQNCQLNIVDEFKGRIAEGRRFSDGLHQALEAKEGVEVKPEQRSIASVTYPNLFRCYPRLAGMSGTAQAASQELEALYGLEVVVIPPHRPSQRVDEPDTVFPDLKTKYAAIVSEVQRCYDQGIPVLVGTRSVEVNLRIAGMLEEAGVACQTLNADSVKNNNAKENALISLAGRSGMVTVSTNMAGRGADIHEDRVSFKQLALSASSLSDPNLLAQYGKDSQDPGKRDDWAQFLKNCKVDPDRFAQAVTRAQSQGQTALPVVIQATAAEAARLEEWFNSPLEQGQPAVPYRVVDGPVAPQPGVIQIQLGQQPADVAVVCLQASDFPTGGLRVIGCERHASRRIDEQLVGRAGRQGRPGSSKFYLSMEDELLRIPGDDRLARALQKAATPGSPGASGGKLNDLIAEAQERVESAQYEARSQTTKFDEPMKRHRQLFYELHEAVVDSAESADKFDVQQSVRDWTSAAVVRAVKLEFPENRPRSRDEAPPEDLDASTHSQHSPQLVRQALESVGRRLGVPIKVSRDPAQNGPGVVILDPLKKVSTKNLPALVGGAVDSLYSRLAGALQADTRFVPGKLEEFQRETILDAMDESWTDHLETMESLKQAANLQSYAGKEPFEVYKRLAFYAFEGMLAAYQEETATRVFAEMIRAPQRPL